MNVVEINFVNLFLCIKNDLNEFTDYLEIFGFLPFKLNNSIWDFIQNVNKFLFFTAILLKYLNL